MKTDARICYTKQALKGALLCLMKTHSVWDITVTTVCRQAGVNRATFYKHYQNCGDLLEQIENELIEEYLASLRHINTFGVTELVSAIFDMIARNLDLCDQVIFAGPDYSILRKMIDATHDLSIAHWRARLPDATDDDLELLFTCLANGLMHVVVEGYKKYDKKTLIAFVDTTVNSCISAYLPASQ